MPKGLRVFGAGRRAELLVDFLRWHEPDRFIIEAFYDDFVPVGKLGPGGQPIEGNVAEGIRAVSTHGGSAAVCLGANNMGRALEVFRQIERLGVDIPSFVAPTANVSPSADVGRNVIVFGGAYIGCMARVGDLATLHANAVVEHHSTVGRGVLLGPGVSVPSDVAIGENSFIGAGASFVTSVRVGDGSLIGAGAVVTRNIPSNMVAYGVPAKCVRPVDDGSGA